ncbi:PREDICTED: UPF0688 protein C1orf174 homolog [Condylura cristata]|uniref:UPF0688 protein C1orf174 homolog n=1 Tax=Condylura cristata TaxID=143302 RepID=UPI000642E1A8|nr:PREDICTED: UPF0688 protein C1orf174 homolog [Condylura cristata]
MTGAGGLKRFVMAPEDESGQQRGQWPATSVGTFNKVEGSQRDYSGCDRARSLWGRPENRRWPSGCRGRPPVGTVCPHAHPARALGGGLSTALSPQPAPSHRASDRRAAKKFKCDQSHLPRRGLPELVPESALPEVTPETPCKSEPLELAGDGALPPQNGADPSAQQEASGLPLGHSHAGSEAGAAQTEDSPALPVPGAASGEDESCCPAGDEPVPEAPARVSPLQMDGSVFLDDDSNQPMPVSRFFGNVELMQDWPPASSSCPSMSRREFRKMHFRAKDDEEDEDGAEV